MFRFVSFMMMILFCLCGAIMALQRIWARKFAISNIMIDSSTGFMFFGIKFVIAFICSFAFFTLFMTLSTKFAFFGLYVTFLGCLIFISLPITFFHNFIFFSLAMAFLSGSALFCSAIFFGMFQITNFATILMIIFSILVFIKFWKRLDLFTRTTLFRFHKTNYITNK